MHDREIKFTIRRQIPGGPMLRPGTHTIPGVVLKEYLEEREACGKPWPVDLVPVDGGGIPKLSDYDDVEATSGEMSSPGSSHVGDDQTSGVDPKSSGSKKRGKQ